MIKWVITVFMVLAVNGVSAEDQQVCTFGKAPLTSFSANQGGARITVECSDRSINSELRTVGGNSLNGSGKVKSEVVKFLLKKGFEIKSDNIMVKMPPPPKQEEKKVIDLSTTPQSTVTQ